MARLVVVAWVSVVLPETVRLELVTAPRFAFVAYRFVDDAVVREEIGGGGLGECGRTSCR